MKYTYIILLIIGIKSYSQSINNIDNSIIEVNKREILSLAKKSQNYTLVYTFSINCEPCIVHLHNMLELSKQFNLNYYILLVNKKGKYNKYAIKYLKNIDKDIKILIIKDEYGKSNNKSYKNFLTDITPKKFKNISDYSKYILIDNNGIVKMVTNYTDNKISNDWRNDMPMLESKIVPFLINN